MALITRFSRLFRADLHAVLDRIEEPDLLLRQAVREMEDALARDEQRFRMLTHESGQLDARRREVEEGLKRADEELDICFESGKDDLARTLIRRQLEAERTQRLLERRRGELESGLTGLGTRLQENRSRLEAMRQKAELLAGDEDGGEPEHAWSLPDVAVRDEDVEVAFLREKKRRAQP
jgi:phage shock protein A